MPANSNRTTTAAYDWARSAVVLLLGVMATALVASSCGDDGTSPQVGQTTSTNNSTVVDGPSCLSDADCGQIGLLCIEGQCTDALCKPGRLLCQGNIQVVCAEDAQSVETVRECPQNARCRNGDCLPVVCEASEVICSGTTRQLCNDTGTAFTSLPCQGERVCFNGECVDALCEVGEVQCLDDLTLGRCDDSQGGFTGELCGFAKRCEAASCVDFYALEIGPTTQLQAPAQRPSTGSIGLWLTRDEATEGGTSDLLAWLHPANGGLRVRWEQDQARLALYGSDPEQPPAYASLPLPDRQVSFVTVSWDGDTVSVTLDGLARLVNAPLTLPGGTPSDTLYVGTFDRDDAVGVAWTGRLGSIVVTDERPELERFVPTCDNLHTRGRAVLHWPMNEGDGDRASSAFNVEGPPMALADATWTGGILGRYARDADNDGYGFDPEALFACTPPRDDEVLALGDCNDGNATVYPEAPDFPDQIDNDCDGETDEGEDTP